MAGIKISASYWNGLEDWQREFLQMYAYTHGVRYCKRILSMRANCGRLCYICRLRLVCWLMMCSRADKGRRDANRADKVM